ncbi:MAG: hypothetical protein JST58_20355 [Bacteroidetes bacterium]|nr:hypothetical protein [Bacteroidota bacterium]
MKKNLLMLLLASHLFSYGQNRSYLKQHAIEISDPNNLSHDIYKAISPYTLIMIGEMHGSNEPAKFAISLADLLTKNNNHVQVGLEIPSDQMKKYLSNPVDSNVYRSAFFSKKSMDARASFAWADIILKLKNNPKIEIFFFDINPEEGSRYINRDSLMYLKIKKRIQLHPTWKTLTLSGNIHNRLSPFNNNSTMGLYLKNDEGLNIADKIASINHSFATGTLLENEENNLQLYNRDYSDSPFATTVDYPNYLFLYAPSTSTNYSGVYFTRKATVSKLVSER